MANTSTVNRIVKNTGYLYVKMAITIFVSLYSTRLILGALGASDFGIFNIVGGAIAMLGFLNSTMANVTQRFMSYAEGEGHFEKKVKIFNLSLSLHLFIAIFTVVFLLVLMSPLFHGVFNIQPDRIDAAKIVYLCLIASTFLTIVNVPYDAVMNAHENMFYYSIVGVFESILKLTIAFICVKTTGDKLVVYGVLMTCVPLISLTIMKLYCHKKYEECIIAPHKYWDWDLVKQIFVFSGWNFLTAISSLFSAQGIGIVLNHFFGTVLNAAQGIAQQVNGSLSNFSGNMMKALNPVIVKNAGAKNIKTMNNAILAGCKFSALLTMLFAIPISIEASFVLKVWLKNVPDWASLFCILQLVQTLILQMANSASTAVYAQGDIKFYAIFKSVMNALPVLLVWLAFYFGGSPIWLYVPMIAVWAVGGDIVIIIYAKKKCGLSVAAYFNNVVKPLIGTALFMLVFGLSSGFIFQEGITKFLITCVLTTIGMFFSLMLFALRSEEKKQIYEMISNFTIGKIKREKRLM